VRRSFEYARNSQPAQRARGVYILELHPVVRRPPTQPLAAPRPRRNEWVGQQQLSLPAVFFGQPLAKGAEHRGSA
jgi:hypothetical protein